MIDGGYSMIKESLLAIGISALMGAMGIAFGDFGEARESYPTATPAGEWTSGFVAGFPDPVYSASMPADVRIYILTSVDCERSAMMEGSEAAGIVMMQKTGAVARNLIGKDFHEGGNLSPDERKWLWRYRPGNGVDMTIRLPSGDYLRRGYEPATADFAGARAVYEACADADLDAGMERRDILLWLLKD